MADAATRSVRGNTSAMMDCEAGVPPASPMPTPIRASSNWPNDPANPHTAVIADHIAVQTANIRARRAVRSANIPSGSPKTGIKSARAVPVKKTNGRIR